MALLLQRQMPAVAGQEGGHRTRPGLRGSPGVKCIAGSVSLSVQLGCRHSSPKCLTGKGPCCSRAVPGWKHHVCLRVSCHKQCAPVCARTAWQRVGACVSPLGCACSRLPPCQGSAVGLRSAGRTRTLGSPGIYLGIAAIAWGKPPTTCSVSPV